MADISTLVSGTEDAVLEFNGQEVVFKYDPNAFTPESEELLANVPQEEKGRALAKLVASLVTEWDLTKDGEPFPPTYENVKTLPFQLLGAVMEAVGTTMQDDSKDEGNS